VTTLIVTAHPDTDSLTHRTAQRLYEVLESDTSSSGTVRLAHLAQEGFDPRFTPADRQTYLTRGAPDRAVAAEQQRFEGVDHVVLVFPVYWWSMPALLKGWIDRVFITGWAFEFDDDDRLVPLLGRITAHLLPISGTSPDAFARHGYLDSLTTQISHGVIDYCGMRRGATAFVYDSESGSRDEAAAAVESAVGEVVAAIG
jgi:NAD(P)H dehydrogenase (quinone)